jgi:hypothetical protein
MEGWSFRYVLVEIATRLAHVSELGERSQRRDREIRGISDGFRDIYIAGNRADFKQISCQNILETDSAIESCFVF